MEDVTEYMLSGMKLIMTGVGLLLFSPQDYLRKENHLDQSY